jgi:hypothetical protein
VFFNPWVDIKKIAQLIEFIEEQDLIDVVDPVQYKIRLLFFRNSLLLDNASIINVNTLDTNNDFLLLREWKHTSPQVEELYQNVRNTVDRHIKVGSSSREVFYSVKKVISGYLPKIWWKSPTNYVSNFFEVVDIPRLDVPNFCCTEPTNNEMLELK